MQRPPRLLWSDTEGGEIMRPTFLRLKGAIGIKRGMGLDEISLDLQDLNGLIALAGENGKGKSTILENLHPYRTLFSRNGSLNQHFYRRDSEKEFCFVHEGHEYKTLLKIDAESERGEAFIWKDGVSQVDGKRTSYDRYIEGLLGSQHLFSSSVFCAQDSRKLTDLRTGELRELFAEFLRLDKLQGWEATAKQCINVLDAQKSQIDRRIGDLGDIEQQISEKQDEMRCISDSIIELTGAYNQENDALGERLTEINDLKAKIAAAQETEKRRIDAATILDNLQCELKKLYEAKAADAEYFSGRQAVINGDLKACTEILAQKESILQAEHQIKVKEADLVNIRKEIDEINENIKLKNEISSAAFRGITDAQKEKEDLANLPEFKDAAEELRLLGVAKTNAQNVLDRLNANQSTALIKQQIAQCEEKMKDLDARDPECQSVTCSFIVGALEAKDKVDILKKTLAGLVADMEAKKHAAEAAIQDADAKIATAGEKHERLRKIIQGRIDEINTYITEKEECICTANGALDDLRRQLSGKKDAEWICIDEIESRRKLAAKAPEIAAAEAKAGELQKQIGEVSALAADTYADHDQKIEDKRAQAEKQRGLIDEIGATDTVTLQTKAAGLAIEISAIQTAIAEDQQKIDDRKGMVAAHQAKIAAMQASRDEIEAIRKDADRLGSEMSEWTYLRDACSKTGLQALEIDGVCPHIQHDANNLLFLTFGANYSIRIETYDEIDQREVFRIWVIREDGSETILDNLSGGQKVWLLKALRLALTLLSKQKSGRNFQSAFADEEDGGLSVENAKAFVDLYRSFMSAGGFESFYYITHKPECLTVADHILTVKAGGVEIE